MARNHITAKDIMERKVVTLAESASLTHAWMTLIEHRISGAPVVSESGELAGVVSQADLLRVAIEDEIEDLPARSYYLDAPYHEFEDGGHFSERFGNTTVEEIMTESVITASPNDNIASLAVAMRRNHVHRLVIVERKKVVGIISALDLLGVLEDH
ncbi:MAG: CBS domain-containing protein [Bdellovibrionales bacterium]|nr:CBS domain-containing protein [Bdellovibrionales bacterium]